MGGRRRGVRGGSGRGDGGVGGAGGIQGCCCGLLLIGFSFLVFVRSCVLS